MQSPDAQTRTARIVDSAGASYQQTVRIALEYRRAKGGM